MGCQRLAAMAFLSATDLASGRCRRGICAKLRGDQRPAIDFCGSHAHKVKSLFKPGDPASSWKPILLLSGDRQSEKGM